MKCVDDTEVYFVHLNIQTISLVRYFLHAVEISLTCSNSKKSWQDIELSINYRNSKTEQNNVAPIFSINLIAVSVFCPLEQLVQRVVCS